MPFDQASQPLCCQYKPDGQADAGRRLCDLALLVRWGMPSSSQALFQAAKKRAEKLEAKGKQVDFKDLLQKEPDGGTTNIRNVASKHWKRWTGPENRCLVPFTSFSEFHKATRENVWFALDPSRPLTCFAGMWVPAWTSVRKVKEGKTTNDLFRFLTTEPNGVVGPEMGGYRTCRKHVKSDANDPEQN